MDSELLEKIEKTYFSIGEVAEILEVKPFVLRFWESEFDHINPKKNNAGIRRYTKADIEQIHAIKVLLHEKKYTIKGAKSVLDSETEVSQDSESDYNQIKRDIESVRDDVDKMINYIDASIRP